jgi:hypothetical protein
MLKALGKQLYSASWVSGAFLQQTERLNYDVSWTKMVADSINSILIQTARDFWG